MVVRTARPTRPGIGHDVLEQSSGTELDEIAVVLLIADHRRFVDNEKVRCGFFLLQRKEHPHAGIIGRLGPFVHFHLGQGEYRPVDGGSIVAGPARNLLDLVAENAGGAPRGCQEGARKVHLLQLVDQAGYERGLSRASAAAQYEGVLLVVAQEGLDRPERFRLFGGEFYCHAGHSLSLIMTNAMLVQLVRTRFSNYQNIPVPPPKSSWAGIRGNQWWLIRLKRAPTVTISPSARTA